MFYKKEGLPNDSELVLCTVKKILPNSVFASLDEYKNREGLIHISEVSPGRIRNIRDFVRIGKQIVCKILRVNRERGQIDLSLRRVSISAKNRKLDDIEQEERAEKILEIAGKKLKKDLAGMYAEAGKNIISNYGSLIACFQDIVNENLDISKELGINEEVAKTLMSVVKESIKPPEIYISAKLIIKNYSSDGVDRIKKVLNSLKDIGKKNEYDFNISYLGAPNYRLKIKSKDYKKANKVLDELMQNYSSLLKEYECEGEVIKL